MKKLLLAALLASIAIGAPARETTDFDHNWSFAFGDASSPAKDFGCGTEYFNYLTKTASIHNEGPYSLKFDSTKWHNQWHPVDLPHDWVVDLPFAPDASHSHGYKTVGHKYPETSVGWYRKHFTVPSSDKGKNIRLHFDGIFRDARVWVNGFYLGTQPSGYLPADYDITEYLVYDGDNIVCVRADATLEEGWFYEGAGIYRHVTMIKTDPVHVADCGTFVHADLSVPYDHAVVWVETRVDNDSNTPATYSLRHMLLDTDGNKVATATTGNITALARQATETKSQMHIADPHLWSCDDPYMYSVVTEVVVDDTVVDRYTTSTGFRDAQFDPNLGFLLNGKQVKLKGVNMHQDHAGVGSAIPDALQVYRLQRLKDLGVNAYRCSHNPPTPQVLDACDRLGIVVIDENRLMGVNAQQRYDLETMIHRDRNHPSVILYSVGNEEWGMEWNEYGERVAETMREFCHRADPTRPMTVASSSGPTILIPADVAGYNYIMQNPVDQHRADYPQRCAIGTEETSGCGTRGIYYDDIANGRMRAINRAPAGSDSCINCIERGWKFYDERPWLGGLFYWTGFDYRGEPNPLMYPATGSEFGILDYCGFPKDEAYYLKSWWTDTPVLHILPHWNLAGHEGESVDVWVYSNCDEVELIVNGRKMGRKAMPRNGHLEWSTVYKPGRVKAIGYRNGRKCMEQILETTGTPASAAIETVSPQLTGFANDIVVCDIEIRDSKGRFVADACVPVTITVPSGAVILGGGNGDPAFRAKERPADPTATSFTIDSFNGRAQFIVRSASDTDITVSIQ